jgi:3-oxoacid CoA-transferase subunit A/3-oxoadipate CoA-transferase alpha subunit
MAAQQLSAEQAIAEVKDGDTLMVGGFGLVGAPLTLINALVEHSTATDLTIISNNTGEAGRGLGLLLRQGRIKKAIASFFTSNPEAVEAAMSGAIEYELLPQGTLAEAIRAGGAGIGGFYTPVGARTELAEGHEERVIDGVPHILQSPLRADVSLVYATWGDELGNLRYRRTAQNFNPAMASAGALTIAEVAEIRPVDGFAPEDVHTPHLYVNRLVQSTLSLADVQGAGA